VPLTDIYLRGVAWSTAEDFIDASLYGGEMTGVGPINVEYKFPDWNATQTPYGDSVGADSEAVFVGYQPENYGLPGEGLTLANHLEGIDNAIGEQFLDSVYVPTSGPLVDLATGMELEVETPEVLTLTGNTVHVRSVDQDHTGKAILVECTLVDQHDRSGRRLKGFEMVGTASDAYSFALTLNGITPLDGSAWENGHREDTGIFLGFSGKAVASLGEADGQRSAQFTSPIPSNDLDDHRISIIVSTGPNPTFNGVIETEFEIVPVWEDANEVYTPGDPAKWESLDPGDPEVPETKREGLDLLVHTVVDLLDTVAGKQAADADLTAIAALAPADDALIQRKAGAWTSRTPAQVKADMSIGVGDVSGLDENTRDVIGTALVAGSGVAVTVDDPGNTITIAVSGVVADAINDGVTTVAPSQNAVFDALALTADLAPSTLWPQFPLPGSATFTGAAALNGASMFGAVWSGTNAAVGANVLVVARSAAA
jgi:hypothetical protein